MYESVEFEWKMWHIWKLNEIWKLGLELHMECRIIYGCIKNEFGNWILNQGFTKWKVA